MLDSDKRRGAFDAFFRSLNDSARTVFLDDAEKQWKSLQEDDQLRTVSLIDCMENIWDLWREIPSHRYEHLSRDNQAIYLVMEDADRRKRESRFRTQGWA